MALEVIVVAVGGSAAMVEAVGVVRRGMIEGRWVVLQDSHQAPYEALRDVCGDVIGWRRVMWYPS